MVLVLVIGDLHVPFRAIDIPPMFKELLVSDKIQHILITGNLCTNEQIEYFKTICSDLHIVKGEFDQPSNSFDDEKVIQILDYKIGLISGYKVIPWDNPNSLKVIQRRLNVDILVYGHSHNLSHWEQDGKIFINPGSATGAYSIIASKSEPSFVLMEVTEKVIQLYTYKLVDNQLKIDKWNYKGKV